MCALVTFTGLALAATSVILIVFASTNKSLNQVFSSENNEKMSYSNTSDFGGPSSHIQFILFRRYSSPYSLKLNDRSSYKQSGFNKSNPTKIIIHGFQSSINEEIFITNKNAYLESGDYNVIGMDWSVYCEFEYFSAINGAAKAARILGQMLDWLYQMGVNLRDVHLVGHSLGAHVAGIAAHEIKTGKIGRITGLDPASPGFRERDATLKLDAADAEIVDVIHTHMEVLSLSQPVGHIDFYPNGGRRQPGCPDIHDIWKITESLVCNHARAYYLFAESIRNKKAFRAIRCHSVEDAIFGRCSERTNVFMGQVETYEFGLYYLRTRAMKPYSL